jgi:hypothetical protein
MTLAWIAGLRNSGVPRSRSVAKKRKVTDNPVSYLLLGCLSLVHKTSGEGSYTTPTFLL